MHGRLFAATRVIVADDHRVVCAGTGALLAADPRLEFVGLATGGRDAIRLVLRTRPDVAVLDVRMPGVSGIDARAVIRERQPATRVVMLTVSDCDADRRVAIRAGASGYVAKTAAPRELVAAVLGTDAPSRQLAAGVPAPGSCLSRREREVLQLVAAGLRNREIADHLVLTEATVKSHVANVLRKLRVRNRAEAAAFAARTLAASR